MKNSKGFTLVEVLIGAAISATLFAVLITTFLAIHSINLSSRHRIQVVEIVQGEVENLKGTAFSAIVDSTTTVPYDSGPDGVYGNTDDESGTLTVTVRDYLDMDDDGNTNETSIDINGDSVNDSVAKPVRVSMSWSQKLYGQTKTFTFYVDTLIAQ